MSDLSQQFEASRGHLRAVAYRMLGSRSEADDAVQEAWLRLARSDTSEVDNLRGWLTTVVARVCLDQLRSRRSRREESLHADAAETVAGEPDVAPGQALADAVGVAMLVVLDSLTPAERVAFVLHDMFDVPFDDVGPIVGRSTAAARQLASRARRRVRGGSTGELESDLDTARQREVVGAFLAASRDGNFAALLALLDPDVVLHADAAAIEASLARQAAGAPVLAPQVRGADAVAKTFAGRARAARLALVDGVVGLVFAMGGQPRVVFDFVVDGGKVVEIELIADAERLRRFELEMLSA